MSKVNDQAEKDPRVVEARTSWNTLRRRVVPIQEGQRRTREQQLAFDESEAALKVLRALREKVRKELRGEVSAPSAETTRAPSARTKSAARRAPSVADGRAVSRAPSKTSESEPQPAPRPVAEHVPGPVKSLVTSLVPGAIVLGLVAAEAALLLPTMHYLRPQKVSGGWEAATILAVMIPAAEIAVGFHRAKLRALGKATGEALVLMVALAALQVGFSYLSEQANVFQTKTSAAAGAVQAGTKSKCVLATMPNEYIGHPDSIKGWTAQNPDPEAAWEKCVTFERNNAKEDAGTQEAAAAHLPWEKYLLSASSGVLSLVIGIAAESINDSLLAALAILGAIFGPLVRWWPRVPERVERTRVDVDLLDATDELPPAGGLLAASYAGPTGQLAPATAPVTARNPLSKVVLWPIRWLKAAAARKQLRAA